MAFVTACTEADKVSGTEANDNGSIAQEEVQDGLRGPGNTPYPGLPLIKSASSAIAVQNYTGSDTANPLHPESLVRNLLISGCLQADNITFAGNRTQIGRFDRELDNPDFPLESGLIISTGSVLNAEGPNDQGDTTTQFTSMGDADLQSLAGYDTNDRAILTFDFVPDGDTVEFRYIFASEEYPEWACSQYNDVFGFFVSGPGISGPFSNNAINVALLPDSTPVAINDIHVGGWNQGDDENSHNPATCPDINASYYVNIPVGATTTQFDGRTTVMTARLENLTPCETYSIKIAIGDTSDQKWDSAVFLEAKSFSSDVEIENIYLGAEAYDIFQGCGPNEIRFFRGEGADTSQALDVTYEITGTAIPGTHHTLTSGTVTIPADQAYVAVPYTVPVVPIDGTKTIVVRVNIACTCDETPTWVEQTIRIHDPFVLTTLSAQDVSSCLTANGSVTALADSGASNYDYVFTYSFYNSSNVLVGTLSPGGNVPAVFGGLGNGVYKVRITAAQTCSVIEQFVTINAPDDPDLVVSNDGPVCEGGTLTLTAASPDTGLTYAWTGPNGFASTDAQPILSGVTSTAPTRASPMPGRGRTVLQARMRNQSCPA